MLNKFSIRQLLNLLIITFVCLMASFLNYCLIQAIGVYFLPLTIVPLFLVIVLEYNVSIILVAGLGLIDDVLLNGPFGLFAFLYSGMSYLVYSKMKHIENKKIGIMLFVSIVLLINILTYCYFK